MADELNGYKLKSYETIRFASGRKELATNSTDDILVIKRNQLLRWLTTHDMWLIIKKYVTDFSEDTVTVDESTYDLFIFVSLCFIFKKHNLQISKSKYKRIKKLARQKKDENFDILIYEDTKVSIPSERTNDLKAIIHSYLSNHQIISTLKKEMSDDLSAEFDIQIWRYSRK